MLVAHYFASFDGILVYVAQIHGKHCSTEHWKRGFMVRVCLHLLAKRFWRPWFFGRPGRNCCWTKGGGLAESGPSLLWLVPQPTPSSHSKLKYSQISKCTTTKIHKHASTKNYGFWANGALLLNTSCHKRRPLSPNMCTNMIMGKHRLAASAALPPRVTNNTRFL